MDIKEIRKANMRVLLAERNLNSSNMKDKTGIDGNYVFRVLNDDDANFGSKIRARFCDHFNLPSDYFDIDRSVNHVIGSALIPVISNSEELEKYMQGAEIQGFMSMLVDEDLYTSTTIAWVHEGDAMIGSDVVIQPGEKLVFDPDLEHEPGDIVLAKLSDGKITVRIFTRDSGEEILKPSNSSYPIWVISENDVIIATCKAAIRRFK